MYILRMFCATSDQHTSMSQWLLFARKIMDRSKLIGSSTCSFNCHLIGICMNKNASTLSIMSMKFTTTNGDHSARHAPCRTLNQPCAAVY